MHKDGSKPEEGCKCHQVVVNASDLQLECARVLHEALLVTVLMYGSETIREE